MIPRPRKNDSELNLPSRDPARVIVVDETEVKSGGRQIYIWAAIEPESRKIVMPWATYTRSGLTALLFFKRLIRAVGKPDVVITEGGPWYTFALRLGIRHEIMSGKERNYVERWFETLKDRARCFDVNYPTHKNRLAVLMEWMEMFILYYNHARYHRILKRPPVPLGGRRERSDGRGIYLPRSPYLNSIIMKKRN